MVMNRYSALNSNIVMLIVMAGSWDHNSLIPTPHPARYAPILGIPSPAIGLG